MAPTPEMANKEWAQARFNELDKDVEEAKTLAIAAKRKAGEQHACWQAETIIEMKNRIGQWEKWWRGIMLAVVGGILSIAAVGWTITERVTKIESGLGGVDSQVTTLSDTVDEVVDTQKEIKSSLDGRERKDRRGDSDLEEIKTMLRDLASTKKPRRR